MSTSTRFYRFFRRSGKSLLVLAAMATIAGYGVHKASGYRLTRTLHKNMHAKESLNGITGYSRIGCNGGAGEQGCHGSSSDTTVVVVSTAAQQFTAGQTYIFNVSVSNTSGYEVQAGCDISNSASLSGGTFDTVGKNSGLWVVNREVTHNTPQTFVNDSANWTFKYTTSKTATGATDIWAAGNAVNGNGLADPDDHWNTTTYKFTVDAAGVSEPVEPIAFLLSPNPSRGLVTFTGMPERGNAEVNVWDATGKTMFRQAIELANSNTVDLSALPNGTYFFAVQPANAPAVVRNIVIAK